MHTANTFTIHYTLKHKFTIKENTLLKIIQDANESCDAFVLPKTLALTILVNCNNLQGHAGTNKTYPLVKRDFFWKGMCKDIDKFIQNYHIFRQHNLQKQSGTSMYNFPKDHVTQ